MQTVQLRWNIFLSICILYAILVSCQPTQQKVKTDDISKPALAKVEIVKETVHGIELEDPYRYMENLKDSGVIKWIKSQDDYTRTILNRIPLRDQLKDRMRELIATTPANINSLRKFEDRYFFMKRNKDEDLAKLYFRDGLEGEDQLLVDPMSFKQGEESHYSISYYSPSWDGKFIAFGVSASGSENATLRIMNVDSREILKEEFPRVQFGLIAWTLDNKGIFFNQLNASQNPMEKYANSKVYFHLLGDDASKQKEIFSNTICPQLGIASADFPIVVTSKDTKKLFAFIIHGVDDRLTLHMTDYPSKVTTDLEWENVFDVEDSVRNLALKENSLFCITVKDAPKAKLVKIELDNPDIKNPELIMPEQKGVLKNISTSKDALYAVYAEKGLGKIIRLPYDDLGVKQELELPFKGEVGLVQMDNDTEGIIFNLVSWTQAKAYYKYNPGNNKVVKTTIQPQSPFGSPNQFITKDVMVKSHDNTMVPLTIMYHKDIVLDGKNPTILYAYGSYGSTNEPSFSFVRYAWLEAGGVYAIAHVRGGGIFGKQWHEAGKLANKPNTWKDFIACAEYLIDNKYTSPTKIGSVGGSAGGITVGRSMTERPDVFKAVVSIVGSSNMVRIGSDPNGPPNYPEFGNPENPEEFKYLYEMDTYQHIKSGQNYPSVMFTGGMNDPRVIAWIPAKAAAKMQAIQGENPVLLRMDFDAGHGIGSTLTQGLDMWADIFAFFMWQFDEI